MAVKLCQRGRVFLAPMAGMNDIAFRVLCKRAGAPITYTGMMNPLSKKDENVDDKPAIQIFTTHTRGLESFVDRYERDAKLFDINLGCPAHIARKQGFGAYFEDMKMIEKILENLENVTKRPLTMKIRKSSNAARLLKLAEKYCDAIAIHPRTKQQGYSGIPDLGYAKSIKKQSSIPVIYSGNVDESNAEELLETFDYLMIGRAALGDPGIFSRITGKDKSYSFIDYYKLAKRYKLDAVQVKIHALYFTKGVRGAKKARTELAKCKTLEEIETIMLKGKSEK